MKMVVHTFNRGVFYTIIAVAVLTFLSGLALSGSDIVNPWTSQAKAAQVEMQTAYAAEKNNIDLTYYEQELEREAQRQNARIQEEINYSRQMNQVKLSIFKWAGIAAIVLFTYSVMLVVFLFFWHRFHQMVARKEVFAQTKPQLTQVYLRPKNGARPSHNGNGHVPYHHPPPPYTNMAKSPDHRAM